MVTRRARFRRESEQARREALIAATLDCIAEGGPAAATTRAIAVRAGVTPGLIRHYFATKNDLIGAAYESLMTRLNEAGAAPLDEVPADALARLRLFVEAVLSPPVVDARATALWAGFLQMVPRDPTIRSVHRETYLAFRNRLESLIAQALRAHGRPPEPSTLRRQAIACNAVIDGLWLEGGVLPEGFADGELAGIGVDSVAAILDLPLARRRRR